MKTSRLMDKSLKEAKTRRLMDTTQQFGVSVLNVESNGEKNGSAA